MKIDVNKFAKFMYESRFEKWPFNKKGTSLVKLRMFGGDLCIRSEYSNQLIIRSTVYGQIIVAKEPSDTLRGCDYFCTFDYKVRSGQAFEWLKKELSLVLSNYENILIEVPAHYKDILKYISRRRFQVESISTISDVNKSFQKLVKKQLELDSSFSFSYMTSADIDVCVKIMKDEYARKPEHGLSIASDAFVDFFKNLLKEEMTKKHSQFVVKDDEGKIRGSFGCFITLNDSFWKSKAGMNFCLDEKSQGKGLLDHMYNTLFLEMKNYKVKVYTGSTSHPAILKRAHFLERKPFAVSFIKDTRCYSLKHFSSFLKL